MGCWRHFGMTGTGIAFSHSPVPLVNIHWKLVTAYISWGRVCLGWQRTRRQKCMQPKAVGNVSSFPRILDNASFPAWPEGTGSWGSPQVISMRNLALSQLFPLPSFFYCLLSQLRMWTLNCTTELYMSCIFPECLMFSCSCIWLDITGCGSLVEKVSSFFWPIAIIIQ